MARQDETGWNDVVTRGVDLGAGMLRLYGQTVRDVAAGKVTYAGLAERVSAVSREEGAAYARSLAQAYLDYWGRVLDIGRDFQERVAGEAHVASRRGAADGTTKPRAAQLEFAGTFGEVATRAFVVQNNQAAPVDVSFEVSEFAAADGASRLRPDLSLEPAAFRLEPGAEQVVTCRLTLAPGFAADVPHDASLRVIGFPGMEIAMRATRFG